MGYFLIALGGAAGSLLRYLVSGIVQTSSGSFFPLGTLSVNTIGCFIVGITGALFFGPFLIREEYRLGLMVGILGGFTTFSAFGWETLSMINDGEMVKALANIAANNILGLIAAWTGFHITQSIFGV